MAKKTEKPRSPRLTPHAQLVLRRRYLKRDQNNRVKETPAQMMARVAQSVAQAEARYGPKRLVKEMADRFYDLMAGLYFLPNSPTLMNAGRELGQLSACFVLPVEDSIESIFNAVRDTALIHKSGGGTGFSFSRVRPAEDLVKSTHGVSSGPISFMNVFDIATETIKQGGVRRGANMGLLSVHHPDIREFISVKAENPGRFNNFNLSVSVTDRFMEAVSLDRDYPLVNPHTDELVKRVPAREVFELMVQSAWASGDPGLVFIDRVNQTNPLPHLGPIEATNPCGEQPLLSYESCTLGSINLARFISRGKLDEPALADTVRLAVRFLDNCIDVNRFPLFQIKEMTTKNRKIGLGVMGLADALIKMGIPYDAPEAPDLCSRVMALVQSEARDASVELGRKRGNFPSFKGSTYEQDGHKYMRNATTTTIAPTGSLSIIAGCSSGIEPLYAVAYRRRVLGGEELVEVHPLFRETAKRQGFWSDRLVEEVARQGSVQHIRTVPKPVKQLFLTAYDLEPQWHLKVQAAFQQHTDNAVSKTVNLPNASPPEVVKQVFLDAYELGLKGVTVYRDRSKADQVLSFGNPASSRPINGAYIGPCPECGGRMAMEAGCRVCPSCGFSVCQ
jgi:ribonucleoside-diphosphate reductase alpha chain